MIRGPAIGVLFDIDRLGADYASKAWELYLPHVEPPALAGTELRDGDTAETLAGAANFFCIVAAGSDEAVAHVRQAFEGLDLPELAPAADRFIDGEVLGVQPLPLRATVDEHGRLVTEEWAQDIHRLCILCRWPYSPKRIPDDLDAAAKAEIARLSEPRRRAGEAPPTGPRRDDSIPQGVDAAGRRWWRFWK